MYCWCDVRCGGECVEYVDCVCCLVLGVGEFVGVVGLD